MNINGQIVLSQVPSGYTPDVSGYITVYVDNNKSLYVKDFQGVSTQVGSSTDLTPTTNSINTLYSTYANSTTVATVSAAGLAVSQAYTDAAIAAANAAALMQSFFNGG